MPATIQLLLTQYNAVTLLLLLVVIGSVIQGLRKGASGSAKHLFFFVLEGAMTVASLLIAWKGAGIASDSLQQWLTVRDIRIPATELNALQQFYYTAITAIRDFALLRYGLLFLIGYAAVKNILYWLGYVLLLQWDKKERPASDSAVSSWISSLSGGIIGILIGLGRAVMVIALLFIVTTLFPKTTATNYIAASPLYQKGATSIVQPITGNWISKQVPVFTRAVEDEFTKILTRKYEVIDRNIPTDIAAAAQMIVKDAQHEEEKARLLYDWVGSRVSYDYNKVDMYVNQNVWKEQTPEDTFASREGVCIDYSRLYAVMARSVGLKVKVVTGLGYDGKGGYGSHAWNEVYLPAQNAWVPLDSTWAGSGDWFNPEGFYETHIKEA
ncbi:cysteine protease [Paenibacillus swuensis]|uniref:Cysteine protease n=1 Tax=Paenibacillus swuensis TaxID=1178515 RepID=A0A172TDE0_9BACL|nr:transglutaminase-like domain-containing protein [Paenibacillus swuensis]ANE45065.1 cysteine protease [Paenibacillus swuensis]